MPVGYEDLLTNAVREIALRDMLATSRLPQLCRSGTGQRTTTSRQNKRLTVSRRFRQWLIAMLKGSLTRNKLLIVKRFGWISGWHYSSKRANFMC